MKNMNTTASSEVLPQFDLNKISCPRCRHTHKHAQEFFDIISGPNKSIILGICDHCRLKAQSQSYELCNECENIIIKFLLACKQKEDLHKYIKTWLSNIEDRLKKKKSRIKKHKSYSDMNLNLLNMKKSKSPCKIKTELLYRSEETLPDIINSKIKEDQKKQTLDFNKTKDFKGRYESKLGKTCSDGSKFKEGDEDVTRQLRIRRSDFKTKEAQPKHILSLADGKLRKDSDYTSEATIVPKFRQKTKKSQILRPLTATDSNAIRKQDETNDSKERLKGTQDLNVRKKSSSKEDRTDTHTAPKIKTVAEKDKVETDERKAMKTQKSRTKDQEREQGVQSKIKKLKTKDVEDISVQNLKRQKSFKGKSIQVKMEANSKEEVKVKTDERKRETSLDVIAKKKRTGEDKQKIDISKRETLAEKRRRAGEDKLKTDEIKTESSADVLTKKNRTGEEGQKTDKSKKESLTDALVKKKRAGEDKLKTDKSKKESLADILAKKKRAVEGKQKANESKTEASTDIVDKKQNIAADLEFKKLQVQVAKGKADELKKQKEFELEEKKAKELAEGKIKYAMKAIPAQETKPSKDFKASKETQINADAGKMAEAGVNKKVTALDVPEKEKLNAQHTAEELEFKKLQAQLAKDKAEELKKQKEFEAEKIKKKDFVEEKIKGVLKTIPAEDAKSITKGETKPAPKREKLREKEVQKLTEKEIEKELRTSYIKLLRPSLDNTILKLIKIRQSKQTLKDVTIITETETKMTDLLSKSKKIRIQGNTTAVVSDSFLELKSDKKPIEDIIIGENMAKYRPQFLPQEHIEREVMPITFQRQIDVSVKESPKAEMIEEMSIKITKEIDQDTNKGIMHYALSDRAFIEKGWTMLPTEKVVRKMNVYRMRPAHPEFDWFERNKSKRLMTYDTGEKLAEFDDNGRGRWYYRNGHLALDYYDAEEINAQQRFVVYSSGEPDERGRSHPITILATFDYLGNGIVFDHAGKIRLKYNQTEGVVLDRVIGPVSHWKWHALNDPPVLQQVMMDTQMPHKDPTILKLGEAAGHKGQCQANDEEMIAIEFDNFIKEKNEKLTQKFKPFQIKMKALKINEHFSLKVLDQASVYLIFRDGCTNIKLNIGMILDHSEIVDTDTAEVGEVSSNMERLPARTDSIAALQRSIAHVQHYEKTLTERERRTRPTVPCASVDKLFASASRPLRPTLRTATTAPSGSTSSAYCRCTRKPSSSNLYYNSRLM